MHEFLDSFQFSLGKANPWAGSWSWHARDQSPKNSGNAGIHHHWLPLPGNCASEHNIMHVCVCVWVCEREREKFSVFIFCLKTSKSKIYSLRFWIFWSITWKSTFQDLEEKIKTKTVTKRWRNARVVVRKHFSRNLTNPKWRIDRRCNKTTTSVTSQSDNWTGQSLTLTTSKKLTLFWELTSSTRGPFYRLSVTSYE